MVESAPYIHLAPVPLDWERKTIHELFAPYGIIKKIYMNPQHDFAKVYLDSVENSIWAYQDVKKKNLKIKITVFVPPTVGTSKYKESGSSAGSDITLSNSYHSRRYTSQDVDTSVTRGYVDVFGRVVTTLQDDDGDIYVSLNELKKSGFELFQLGALPSRNSSHIYDEQKLVQFELYMKMKAAKFMATHNFHVSDIKVNSIIEHEKGDYFGIGHVGANSTMRMSIGDSRRNMNEDNGFQPPLNHRQHRNRENFNYNNSDRLSCSSSGEKKIASLMDVDLVNKDSFENMLKNKNEGEKNRIQRSVKTRGGFNQSYRNTSEVQVNNNATTMSQMKNKAEITHSVKPITRVVLSLHQQCQVTVVHVESEHIGWVQLSKNSGLIESLLVDTVKECENASPAKPVVNTICGALFTNIWFRAVVTCSSPLKVQYIDYGNENTEYSGEIRQLSNKLTEIPGQAVRISIESNPGVKLNQDMDLTITPIKQNTNGTYVVEIKGNETSVSETLVKEFNSAVASNKSESCVTPQLRKPHSVTNLKQTVRHKTETKLERKLVIEKVSEGIFQFIDMTSARTFTGFALLDCFTKEFSVIENIKILDEPDLEFKPNAGDIVAAYNNDGFVRGLVLNASNGHYTCALIDYGTIKMVNEVRRLPEDCLTIPEFVFECEAEPSVIEELKAIETTSLQITSPCNLTLTAKMGKTYNILGKQWNPVESCFTNKNNAENEKNMITTKSTIVSNKKLTTLDRKTVIEDLCENGVFEFVTLIDDTSFIAFVCPFTFTEEAELLENISDDSLSDSSFKPNPGDLIAAVTPDGTVRGTVLSVTANLNYECALIDYGTIKIVEEVRKLPDKYKNIPEFAILCKADKQIVQDIQNNKCETLKITSPFVLSLTLESGKQYNVNGSRWIPFKSEPPILNTKLPKEVNVSAKVNNSNVSNMKSVSKISKSNVNLKHAKVEPKRKLVIEDCSESGIFDFIEAINETNFTCFICPEAFANQIAALDEISKDTCFDKSFSPKVGDLVAASSPDGFVRGIVLNVENGEYQCALIDYGTINNVSEVRALPDKYHSIPEFACECTADATTVEELKNLKCTLLQIKTPFTLTITLESGSVHIIKGSRWDPKKGDHSLSPSNPNSRSNVSNNAEQQTLATRTLVIDEICSEAVFEFTEIINEKTFVGFVFSSLYANEANQLEKINDDCQPDPSFKPNPGDLVAAPGPDGYVRAIIIDIVNQQYRCALIDYGLTKTVDNVRPLPDTYKSIPEFAFQCTADSCIVQDVQQFPCQSLQIKAPCTLTLLLENGKQYVVKGSRWNPLVTSETVSTKESKVSKEEVKEQVYKRPSETILTDGEQIIIVGIQENTLLVRNKECNSLFKSVCNELKNYEGKPFQSIPQVGCLAVCNFQDNNLYRVVINKIDDTMATVEYIDYGDIDVVSIPKLKNINENLALMNSTLVKIHLKDFNKQNFSVDMLKSLSESSEKKEKFVVRKLPDEASVYDLIGSNKISLSETFKNSQKTNITLTSKNDRSAFNRSSKENPENTSDQPTFKKEDLNCSAGAKTKNTSNQRSPGKSICRLHDIVKCNVNVGDNQLLCLFTGYMNEGTVSFCKADEETVNLLQHVTETIPNYIKNDNKPYVPSLFEICLVKFDEEWCRASIVKINDDNTYGVFYVDYGNSHVVETSEIRKLPQELSKIRALAMLCKIEGVLNETEETVNDRLLGRFLDDIVENQIYNVKITSIDDNQYSIIIPSLLEGWKKDGLL